MHGRGTGGGLLLLLLLLMLLTWLRMGYARGDPSWNATRLEDEGNGMNQRPLPCDRRKVASAGRSAPG